MLKDVLNYVNDNQKIRIFAGCMTLFEGKKSDVTEKVWNRKVGKYLGCELVGIHANNDTLVIVI